jgi:hypothetical protein
LKKNQIETSLREVPFSVSLEGNLVEGKIDLLFEEDGGWVIVDYRTDGPTRNRAPGMPGLSIKPLGRRPKRWISSLSAQAKSCPFSPMKTQFQLDWKRVVIIQATHVLYECPFGFSLFPSN